MSRIQVSKQTADSKLSPAQRRFNQLTARIAQLRVQLTQWQDELPLFRQSWLAATTPLREQLIAGSHQWVTVLDSALAQKNWTRTERRLMTQMLLEEINMLIDTNGDDEKLKALYNQHSDIDFDSERQEDLDAFKELTETMTGIDFGDEEFSSEEELMQRMQERAAEQKNGSHDDPFGQRQQKTRKQTAKQRAAEQKREAEAAMTKQSVRDIYRKLASALHPDKEPDPTQREAKTAMMARVNKAYEANDLLALLEAQLQIEQIDASTIAAVTAERLGHYNKVLAEQVDNLMYELDGAEFHCRMEFAVPDEEAVHPSRLGRVLAHQIRTLRMELAQQATNLRAFSNKDSAKRWLRAETRARREEDEMFESDFELPF